MIYIARDGKQQGPYPLEQINGLLASGQLQPEDLSWWEGAPEWMPVSKAPGVVLPSTPAAVTAPVAAPLSFGNRTAGSPAAESPSPYTPPRGAIAPGAAGFGGQVSPGAVLALRQTRPWVLFLAVLAAIGAAFMVLGAIALLASGGAMLAGMASGAPGSAGSAALPAGFFTGIAFIYLIMALLYLYPITRLFKYSSAISRLNHSASSADLEDALRFQKSFWKFFGMLALILIVLYFVGFVLMIAFGGSIFKGASSIGDGMPTPIEAPAAPQDPFSN